MSLARQTREHVHSLIAASAPASGGGLTPAGLAPEEAPYTPAASIAAQQVMMRLQHDLRRLKEIKSVSNKVAAKREMIGGYAAWVDGALAAGEATDAHRLSSAGAEEVLPTMMVWSIDIGDWPRALRLAEHVLRFDVALPARYQRDAATLVLEEVAEAALKVQAQGKPFPQDVLEQVEALVAGVDMHDEPRAKLLKAIGVELARTAETATGDDARRLTLDAIAHLTAAQGLHDRVGVKTHIKGLEKALATFPAPADPAPGDAAPGDADRVVANIDTAGIADAAVRLHAVLTGLAASDRQTPADPASQP